MSSFRASERTDYLNMPHNRRRGLGPLANPGATTATRAETVGTSGSVGLFALLFLRCGRAGYNSLFPSE
jgi:hypothetical protein